MNGGGDEYLENDSSSMNVPTNGQKYDSNEQTVECPNERTSEWSVNDLAGDEHRRR